MWGVQQAETLAICLPLNLPSLSYSWDSPPRPSQLALHSIPTSLQGIKSTKDFLLLLLCIEAIQLQPWD